MAINERVITGTTAAAGNGGGANEAEQGLILHLDANDVDSYDGDGDVWYDISEHDVTIPLSDNADDLGLHLNASDTTSYDPATDTTTWTDISGNSNDATLTGLTNTDHDIDNGGFFTLDGSSDFGTVSHNTNIDLSSSGFTAEVWIYHTDSNKNMILDKGTFSSRGYGYNLQVSSDNLDLRIHATGGTGATIKILGTEILTGNQWNHVAFSVSDLSSSATAITYVNGEQDDTDSGNLTSYTNTSDLLIGSAAYTTADRFDGRIGAVRIYSKALSASEIGQNYRHGRDYIYTGLNSNSDLFLHYDPADTNSYSGTGTTLTDLVGNNNADLLGGIESGWDEELGNSFPITGSGDGITTSSTVSINPATDGMTIEMWVKIKTDAQNYLFSFDGTNTTYFGLSYRSNSDKIAWFYRSTSGSNSVIYSDTIVLNEWTHIVATTDGSSAQFYTNGVLSEETSSSAYSYTYNEDLHFGNYFDLNQNSNSDVGQIRFYKGQLSADEVMQNYNFTKNDYPNGSNQTIDGATFTAGTGGNPDLFSFDGTNDSISLDDRTASNTASGSDLKGFTGGDDTDYTISFYINTGDSGGHTTLGQPIIGYTGSDVYAALSVKDGKFTYNHYNGSWNHKKSTTSINDSEWHHCVFVHRSDATIDLYVDGTKEVDDVSATLTAGRYYIAKTIGKGYDDEYIDMDFGMFKMYDKALTSSEVTLEFNSTKSTYGL